VLAHDLLDDKGGEGGGHEEAPGEVAVEVMFNLRLRPWGPHRASGHCLQAPPLRRREAPP
jgi:hypothetical protein